MSKNLNIKKLTGKFKPLLDFIRRDSVAIFLLIVSVVFGFLIWRIGQLANAEPDQSAIDEQSSSIVRPRIDPESIKTIEELESQNIDIETFFSERENPFQE